MNEPIKLQISEYGYIPGAISRLEESTVGCPDVCILICEELLDHLLKSGYRKIGVTVKGRKMRVIEIRAEREDSPWRKRKPNWPKSVGNYTVSLPFRGFDPGLSSHHSYHLDKNDEND